MASYAIDEPDFILHLDHMRMLYNVPDHIPNEQVDRYIEAAREAGAPSFENKIAAVLELSKVITTYRGNEKWSLMI